MDWTPIAVVLAPLPPIIVTYLLTRRTVVATHDQVIENKDKLEVVSTLVNGRFDEALRRINYLEEQLEIHKRRRTDD